jgi:hypothetical protein
MGRAMNEPRDRNIPTPVGSDSVMDLSGFAARWNGPFIILE